MIRYFIVAGDQSGDIHAARLMKSLKLLQPEADFIGIGGKNMRAAGLRRIAPFDKMSVVGFYEAAKNYYEIKKIFNRCVSFFEREKIDAFIPVDYPGFNLRLSKRAKINNIPVIYYIAPQLWAWGQGRAKAMANNIDLLLCVFPFELEFFRSYGINVKFVGHPLLDEKKFSIDFPNVDKRENLIALLPGSRKQEIKKHLPIMEKVADRFIRSNPEFKIALSISSNLESANFDKYLSRHPEWTTYTNSVELMMRAKAGIVKTGTSNLEAALSGMPFVMIYKTSTISYFLGKSLINLESLSLVNILLKKKLINEYVQGDIRIEQIVERLGVLAKDEDISGSMQNEFMKLKNNLGQKGASNEAARQIVNYMNPGNA